jgi:Polysaccharide deacetylase
LLKVYDEFQIPGVMNINGIALAAYPELVQAAVERQWEFVGHGFTQRNMQKVANEREDIRATAQAIEKATGKRPRGWLGPGLTEGFRADHGDCGGRECTGNQLTIANPYARGADCVGRRSNAAKLSCATLGASSLAHLAGEMLAARRPNSNEPCPLSCRCTSADTDVFNPLRSEATIGPTCAPWPLRNPISGSAGGCARDTTVHETAPPTPAMNLRRRIRHLRSLPCEHPIALGAYGNGRSCSSRRYQTSDGRSSRKTGV